MTTTVYEPNGDTTIFDIFLQYGILGKAACFMLGVHTIAGTEETEQSPWV